ncbi:MAG: DNA-processing protein DprA [Lachnospiraceae bacterium]|nr:DNA-processing protein DprA [Lachnospiraceae bacterium]
MNRHETDLMKYWFSLIQEPSYQRKQLLVLLAGSIEALYHMDETDLRKIFADRISDYVIDDMIKSRDKTLLEEKVGKLKEAGIRMLYPELPEYPDKLKAIPDPPFVLFTRGNEDLSKLTDNMSIAIVGARKTDAYGSEMSYFFARELSFEGITVISGLAAGVDGRAHAGCIEAGGKTIAVLGCGVDIPYPRSNTSLYFDIIDKGLIISEFPPGTAPLAWRFPVRNRIISGLSDGILVVEARAKSGSLITADAGLEQGKTIFALPGRAYDVNAAGTNNLIKQGAICVTEPADIIRELKNDITYEPTAAKSIKENAISTLSDDEIKLFKLLNLDPVYIDDLIARSGFDITKTISALYTLEKKGLIHQVRQGWYITGDFTQGVLY